MIACRTPWKRKFGDQTAAEAFRIAIATSGKRMSPTYTYICECGLWHIASSDRARKQRRRIRQAGRDGVSFGT